MATPLKDLVTKEELYQLYVTEGKSTRDIGRIYGKTSAPVFFLLKEYGIKTRNNKEGQRNYFDNNLNISNDVFLSPSTPLYYILGLWITDGCIHKRRMELALNDKDVIDWTANILKYTNTITERTTKEKTSYRISFFSDVALNFFENNSVTERKSYSVEYPKVPEQYQRDFIRGVFDGDGSIQITKRKSGNMEQRVSIVSASEVFLREVKSVIETALNKSVSFRRRGENLYEIYFSSKSAVVDFGEWLYDDTSCFGMGRKRDKFRQLGANI